MRDPRASKSLLLLARCLYRQGRWREALSHYQLYISQQPMDFRGFVGAAECHYRLHQPCAQQKALQRAFKLQPQEPQIILQLAQNHLRLAEHPSAQTLLRRFVQKSAQSFDDMSEIAIYDSLYASFQAHYLMSLYSDPECSDAQLLRALNQGLQGTQKPSPQKTSSPPPRSLRVGYLARDFAQSATAQVLVPLLMGHSERIEVYLYDDGSPQDALNTELRERFQWRPIAALNNAAAAELILADQLHVLVDVHGLTHPRRQGLFARRPALVQLSGPGFVFSAGHPYVDARCLDAHLSAALEGQIPERLYHAASPLSWSPPQGIALSAPPCLKNKRIRLGSANGSQKLNAQVLSLWAQILQALPEAELLLKSPSLSEPEQQERIQSYFRAQGVAPERISIEGGSTQKEHLQDFYAQIDIALDPFPYQGGLNTLEALWMGVPVVVMGQPQWQSRALSVSLLRILGLQDWVCANSDAYIARVCHWAQRPAFLKAQRRSLRSRLERSAVCRLAHHVQTLEAAYFQELGGGEPDNAGDSGSVT